MKAKTFSSRASFVFHDKEYYWKDTFKSAKLRSENGDVLAQFKKRSWTWNKDGEMEIYNVAEEMVDIILITFVMYLYRRQQLKAYGGAVHGR